MFIVNNYVGVLSKYAGFRGRATRSEYWLFVLASLVVSIVVGIVGSVLGLTIGEGAGAPNILILAYTLAVMLPSIAVMVRRFHDAGHSGWMALLILIPIIGLIAVIVFMILPSQQGDNRHGPDPRGLAA